MVSVGPMIRTIPLSVLLALAAGPVLAQQPGPGSPPGSRPSPPPAQAQPAPAQPPQPAAVDRNGVLVLVRTTLLALDAANRTGNYTVLRDMGAPGFQAANNAARLSEIFANLRAQGLDLGGVAVLEPQLTAGPQVDERGMLRLTGLFPSAPLQVNFDMLFTPVEGRWRLFGLSVGLAAANAGPAEGAPEAKPEAAAQPQRPPARPGTPAPARAPQQPARQP